MNSRTAATVILYQPNDSVLENICSYINAVEKLYVIDNSTTPDKSLVDKIRSLDSRVVYLANKTNQGIASALNRGAQEAITAGYQWLLTMDQDSKFSDINNFFSCCKKQDNYADVAIFAPNTDAQPGDIECSYILPKVVISSGNIINLKHYRLVGGFESKLFIDEIDHDFCLKLGERNLTIVQFLHIALHHAIGEETQLTSIILHRKKHRMIHNYQRIYYQTRNRLYMAKRHSKNYPEAFSLGSVIYKIIYKKIIRIIQWEPDKLRKLKAIYHGVSDYLNNNYGIYDTDNRDKNNS